MINQPNTRNILPDSTARRDEDTASACSGENNRRGIC